MILIRSGFGIAALAAGIVAGFVLYRSPSDMSRLGQHAFNLSRGGDFAQAADVYSEQIRRRPADYILYLRRGLTEKLGGDPGAAVADFDVALRLIPQPLTADELGPRLYNSALAETHLHNMAVELHTERAEVFEKLGRVDDALADLDSALALNGRVAATLQRRANLRMLTGQLAAARADFEAVMQRGTNVEALFGHGLSAYLLGDWMTAATDFGQALQRQPRSGVYALWLLKAQLRGHQPIPLDEFKGVPPTNSAWPWINAFLGDYDGGSIAGGLREAAGQDPVRVCDATYLLGEWFLIKGSRDQAAVAFGAAREACPHISLPQIASTVELRRLAQPVQPIRTIDQRR